MENLIEDHEKLSKYSDQSYFFDFLENDMFLEDFNVSEVNYKKYHIFSINTYIWFRSKM